MSVCAGCRAELSWNGTELVDPDGAPHRLTCPALRRDRRWLGLKHRYCSDCGVETTHEVVRDQRSELWRCSVCGRGREVRPVRRRPAGRR